jgi:hypothetical protein
MDNLCKYQNSLGEPGKGLHSYRIGNVAIIDVIFVILASLLLQKFYNKKINIAIYLIVFFTLGIFFHRLFCVRTTVDKFLFRD